MCPHARRAALFLFLLAINTSCQSAPEVADEEPPYPPAAVDTTQPASARLDALFAEYDPDRIRPFEWDSVAAAQWVDETLSALTLDEKIGQLIIVDLSDGGIRGLFSDPTDVVRDLNIGGFLVPRLMSPRDVHRRTSSLQQVARVPLFFAADYERGVGRFNNALTELPSNMAIGATRDEVLAAAMGRLTAIESRAIGINLVFAPVVDVNNNPNNPIINIRSYGEDASLVGQMAAAYVREAQRYGVQTTLKHFPGHGDTAVDTHARMAVVESDRAALDSVELRPYRVILDQDVQPAAVMSAHLWVPAIDEEAMPATFSQRVLTGVLRDELGFEGFVVTDDVKMGALQGQYSYEDRVLGPLEAGADIILTPPDPTRAVEIVRRAVRDGRLTEQAIDASVRRILWGKARAGLYDHTESDDALLDYLLEESRGAGLAQAIADEAITLLKSPRSFPLQPGDSVLMVHFTNYRGSESIDAAMTLLERRQAQFSNVQAHRFQDNLAASQIRPIVEAAAGVDVVVVALYLRLIAGRGDAALQDGQARLVSELIAGPTPVILVTFGNPYAVSSYPEADGHLVAYDQSLETVRAVHRVLTGELEPSGRLPITVEPYPFGAGR